MDSGARVRVTAQHPVLTTTGWVDASDLREGQNLLCYANQVDVIDPTVTANGQKQHPPLVAEQVFRALAPEGVITVPRAAFNLNGDLVFIQGDVDVVTANRSLMDALQAGIREMLDELGFKGSDPRMVILPGHRSGQAHRIALGRIVPRRPGFFGRYVRMFAQKIRSMMKDCGTYGVQFDPVRFQVAGQPFSVHVMGRGDGLEGFASEVTVDDISRYRAAKLRARDTSFLDASEPTGFLSGALAPSFRDVFVGGFGVNAETGRDLLDAHPGLIKADQIVNVRRFEYVGHVYDFQCSNGLIVAQGGDYLTPSPIISNCRCRRIALTEKQAARFLAADTKRLQDPDAARARVEAQPDQGWDYNPCAEPDEGLRRAWAAKVGKVHPLLAEAAGPNLPRYPKTNVIADAPPVPLEIKGKVSAEFQKEVRSTLDRIPAPARSVLNAASSKIVAARTLTGARPDLKGVQPRGWPEGSTWDSADGCASGGVAYVAERYRDFWSKGKLWKNSERTQYVVLHELGHAYDDGSGNVSASLEFLKAYADDVARAEDNNLVINSYFLQHGDAGRRETFAEQFYNVIGGNSDMNMPSTYAYLRAMLGLDTTEVVP
jgi:hypothetical protein